MAKSKPLPPVQELRKRYSYDPITGVLTSLYTGQPIKAQHTDGYLYVRFGGHSYLAHRVIWKLMTGQEPPDELDHAKGQKANNRWRHLRRGDAQRERPQRRRATAQQEPVEGCHQPVQPETVAPLATKRGSKSATDASTLAAPGRLKKPTLCIARAPISISAPLLIMAKYSPQPGVTIACASALPSSTL